MAKFCDECQSILTSEVSNKLIFKCRCGKTFNAAPEDTLLYEIYPEATSSNQKFIIGVENSSFDLAGKKVERKCNKCNLDYMTRVYVSSIIIHTCICGNIEENIHNN